MEKLHNQLDYIALKRYDFSLAKLMIRYPDGVPDHVIADALSIEESEIDALYKDIVKKLQSNLGVDNS